MIVAAVVCSVVAVLALLYTMMIVFDKSITPGEMSLLRTTSIIMIASLVSSILLWAYSWSQANDKASAARPLPPLQHDTLWLHDTTVKYVKGKVEGATKSIKEAAAQADIRSPLFLEKFDAR